jgi:hypothetical protein
MSWRKIEDLFRKPRRRSTPARRDALTSIFAPEPELRTAPQYADLVRGSGGLFRLGLGRPSLCAGASLEDLRRQGGPRVMQFRAKLRF